MIKASGFTNFTRLGVESKVAHEQNPSPDDIHAPIDNTKSEVGLSDFKRSSPLASQTFRPRNRYYPPHFLAGNGYLAVDG